RGGDAGATGSRPGGGGAGGGGQGRPPPDRRGVAAFRRHRLPLRAGARGAHALRRDRSRRSRRDTRPHRCRSLGGGALVRRARSRVARLLVRDAQRPVTADGGAAPGRGRLVFAALLVLAAVLRLAAVLTVG